MLEKINPKDLRESAVELFDSRWGLLAAGKGNDYNMMTVSWGMLGELWGRNVCTVFVRPQRHTYGFMEENDTFSVSFFAPEYKKALLFCGTKSGRDYDKAKETGLTVTELDGAPAFSQAEITVICRKLYTQDIEEKDFLDKKLISECYPEKDFHRVYVGEIKGVYVKRP